MKAQTTARPAARFVALLRNEAAALRPYAAEAALLRLCVRPYATSALLCARAAVDAARRGDAASASRAARQAQDAARETQAQAAGGDAAAPLVRMAIRAALVATEAAARAEHKAAVLLSMDDDSQGPDPRRDERPDAEAPAPHAMFSGHRWMLRPNNTGRKSNARLALAWDEGGEDAAAMRELTALFEMAHAPMPERGAGQRWIDACGKHDAAIERWSALPRFVSDARFVSYERWSQKSNSKGA